VYAYLREELVNEGPTSSNSNHMLKNSPNLMHFFMLMENIFSSDLEDTGINNKPSAWYKTFKEANSLSWESTS